MIRGSCMYGRAVLGQVGEEAAQALVVLAEAAVDDDQAEVVLGVEQMVEALGEEHQAGRVDVLRAAKEVGLALGAELEVEQGHVCGERRDRERREDGVGERRRNLALADPVPLDLAVERPAGRGERLLPHPAKLRPVGVAHRDPSEREEPALVDLAALVEEEQMQPAESSGSNPCRGATAPEFAAVLQPRS